MTRDWTNPESWTDNKAINTDRLNEISTQLTWLYEMMFAKEGTALTIASGVITVTGNEAFYKVSGQGAAADELVTINGGTDGDIIILTYDGEAITLKETGNIETGDYGDLVMDAVGNAACLRYDGSNWLLLSTNVLNVGIANGNLLKVDGSPADNEWGRFTTSGLEGRTDAELITTLTERLQDLVGAMFSGNTETRVTVTYQDSDGTIDIVVDVCEWSLDTTPVAGGDVNLNNKDLHNMKQVDFQDEHNDGDSGAADTINWNEGNNHKSTLSANCTFAYTAPAGPCHLQHKLVQDATGSRTVTWPATVKWAGGSAPTLSTAANAVDIIGLWWDGTNYWGVASLGFA